MLTDSGTDVKEAGDAASLRNELEKCHLGRFDGSAGEVAQRTELTARQTAIFKALGVPEPPRIFGLAPAEAAVTA